MPDPRHVLRGRPGLRGHVRGLIIVRDAVVVVVFVLGVVRVAVVAIVVQEGRQEEAQLAQGVGKAGQAVRLLFMLLKKFA